MIRKSHFTIHTAKTLMSTRFSVVSVVKEYFESKMKRLMMIMKH